MSRKKNSPPKEIVDELQPNMEECLMMYADIMDILYKTPKTRFIDIDVTLDLIKSRLMHDKMEMSIRKIMMNPSEFIAQGGEKAPTSSKPPSYLQ